MIEPELAAYLEGLPRAFPAEDLDRFAKAAFLRDRQVPPPPSTDPDLETEDVAIAAGDVAVPARIYRPATGRGPYPLIVSLHGGGWVLGNIALDDRRCRALAREVGAIVLSVGYRLAPEHPFPAPLEDCYAALSWAAEHSARLNADPDRLILYGTSAGGNLAAAACLMARARGGPRIALQALVYPVCEPGCATRSFVENADIFPLTADDMRWFWDQYVPEEARRSDPLASPLLAEDLSGLPPALILTAEHDPLRDEGEAYGLRLVQAGVPVLLRRCIGMVHGFLSVAPNIPSSISVARDIARLLRSWPPLPDRTGAD